MGCGGGVPRYDAAAMAAAEFGEAGLQGPWTMISRARLAAPAKLVSSNTVKSSKDAPAVFRPAVSRAAVRSAEITRWERSSDKKNTVVWEQQPEHDPPTISINPSPCHALIDLRCFPNSEVFYSTPHAGTEILPNMAGDMAIITSFEPFSGAESLLGHSNEDSTGSRIDSDIDPASSQFPCDFVPAW